MYRLKTFRAYFIARAKRIFPSLILVCFVLAFIAGPVLTELSAEEYFKDSGTYKYMLNGFLILQHDLPGVFAHNSYGRTVNGSLWTLPVEFLCYIMCFLLFKMGLLEKRIKWTIPVFIFGCIAVKFISKEIPILESTIRPVSMFYMGMLYFSCRDRIRMCQSLCFGALLGLAIGMLAGFLQYLLAYIGFATKIKFSDFARRGEISYGIYLCAFPVQQTLCQLCGGQMKPWLNFMLAAPIAISMGFICCRMTEKMLVKCKKTETEGAK